MRREGEATLLSNLLDVATRTALLSAEEETALARAAVAGSQPAFDRLLAAHVRLVLSIAHSLRKYGLPMEDLVGEGLVGLVEAARRFDPERGVRLGTYAAKAIRASMRRYTLAHRRIVRLPSTRDGRKLLANLRRAQHAPTAAGVRQLQPIQLLVQAGVQHVYQPAVAARGPAAAGSSAGRHHV